jgi:hypothetical protein
MKETMQDTWQKFQQELVNSDNNCGACGLFISDDEMDSEGFHSPNLCDANDTHCDECDNGTDSPCINCQWDESVK